MSEPEESEGNEDEALTPAGRRRVYRVVCYLAEADDELNLREEHLLDKLRRKLELSTEEAEALAEEARRGEKLAVKTTSIEARSAVHYLAILMVADGVLHPAEAKRLKRIAAAVGVSEKELAGTLQKAMQRQNRREG